MAALNLDETHQMLFAPDGRPRLVVNGDTADTAYLAPQRPVTRSDVPLPPQASVVLDGSMRWFASTLDPQIMVPAFVLPSGLGWDNPVGVQIALSALGLATDASVQAVKATLGSPAQNATVAGLGAGGTLGGLLGQLQSGVAPWAPNLVTFVAKSQFEGGSPVTIHTFTTAGRIWMATLSFALSANASHAGNDQAYAELYHQVNGGGTHCLALIEAAIGGANNTDSGDQTPSFPGLEVAGGDSLVLDINNAVPIANAQMRASASVGVTFP